MKLIFTFLILLLGCLASAQKNIERSTHFLIEGRVKDTATFYNSECVNYTSKSIDSVVILNHLMQRRHTIKNIKGILLKDVLSKKILFDAENPKALSEYFIECVATDNYKVVFSWNELFNTETGNNVLVITEEEGRSLIGKEGDLVIITPTDFATGRRYVKGLKKVLIKRVD